MHSNTEIGQAVAWLVGIAVFVVVGLTQVPYWFEGNQGASQTGQTMRLIK